MWAFRLEDSPSGHSLVVLAALVPRSAVGYPLLSLTRNSPSRDYIGNYRIDPVSWSKNSKTWTIEFG